MEYWSFGILCCGADLTVSAVTALLIGRFFSARYALDSKRKEIAIFLFISSTALRFLMYGFLMLVYYIFVEILNMAM